MAVGQFWLPGGERHVQPVGAKLHHRIAGCALSNFDLDAGIFFSILRNQLCEEAVRDQGMDADAQTAPFSCGCHASGVHRMVELIDAGRYLLDEVASSLGQPDTPRMALEQEDAKVFFQGLNAGTDAGLRYAKCIGDVTEVQIC